MEKRRVICWVLAGVLSASASLQVVADTVVTTDGRRISGEVEQTIGGYTIKTKVGAIVELKTHEVTQWIKGDAITPTAPKPPALGTPATGTPASKPATTQGASTRPADARSVDALLKQGQDAILAQDYKAARDAFLDAVSLEPRNIRAVHGMALSLMYLGDFPRAQTYMERAMAASAGKPDRALVLNNAMLQIALGNPLRALKFIKDYIEAHPNDADEPILNALGSAIFSVEEPLRRNILWNNGADLYVKYQKTVEAAHPGQKRWGVEWLPANEVDKKMADLRRNEQAAFKVGDRTDRAEDKVIDAKRKLRRQQAAYAKGNASQIEVDIAAGVLATNLTEFQKLAKEYDDAMEKVVRPVFPRVLTPVAIDDVTPPSAGSTTLAMADPAYKQAVAKAAETTAPVIKRAGSDPDENKPKPAPAVIAPPPAVVAIKNDKVEKVRLTQYAAAFAVADDLVITAAAPLENAVDFELQTNDGAALKAKVVRTDPKTNLALLKIINAPGRKLPFLLLGDSSPAGQLACLCFPTVNLFNPAPEALPGIAGAPTAAAPWTVKLSRHPRLAGSPLMVAGKVIGVVTAGRDAPADLLPALPVNAIRAFLAADAGDAGSKYVARDPSNALMQLVAIREIVNK